MDRQSSPLQDPPSFPLWFTSNAFLISAVRCERNEQNQPHEQGHPNHKTMTSPSALAQQKPRAQITEGKGGHPHGRVTERQSWCQASANYQGLGVLLKVTQEQLIPASTQPVLLQDLNSRVSPMGSPPPHFPRRKVNNYQNQNRCG